MTEKMISISKEEIGNKMFFINEKDSDQPIAVIKVSDLLEKEKTEDFIKVCWNCKHFGEKAATGHCIKCRDKDMWEVKKNENNGRNQ